jgi:hypothetical protein
MTTRHAGAAGARRRGGRLAQHRIERALPRKRICGAEHAGEPGGGTRCIHDQFVGDLTRDRRAVLGSDRRTQHQSLVAWRRGDIGSPRRPHQGKAMAKQKTVAGVHGGGRIIAGRRFVQLTEDCDIAAVVDLVQKRAVASGDIGGTQHQEFGAEFHQSAIVARRQLEIGNSSIRRSVRIEREEGATAQLFIDAGPAEFGAGGEGLAAQDLDPLNPGAGGRREAGCSQRQARDDELAHDPCLPSA